VRIMRYGSITLKSAVRAASTLLHALIHPSA
jgi:hypothetical protein